MKQCINCKTKKQNNDFELGKNTCRICRNKQRQSRPKKKYQVSLIEKVCIKCDNLKPALKFSLDPSRIGGLHCYCDECRNNLSKTRYNKNSEEIKLKNNKYYYKNKTQIIEKANIYNKERRKTDPKFLLTRRLRARLYSALKSKGWNKTNKFVQYIGCSQEQLKQHIEKQFQTGMSWDNSSQWHIDHIIPLASASSEDEMYKLCHYTNLQPLWAIDNIKKGTN